MRERGGERRLVRSRSLREQIDGVLEAATRQLVVSTQLGDLARDQAGTSLAGTAFRAAQLCA